VTGAFAYATFGDDGRGGIAAYRVNLDTGALGPLATTAIFAIDPEHGGLTDTGLAARPGFDVSDIASCPSADPVD
jgi:hypothetical protein